MKLFSDEDDGGDSAVDKSKIEINHEFARRFEHNKKREDLQRFEELKKKGIIDSDHGSDDDSSEDDEDDIVNYSSKQDLKFFDALIKVRNKDPILKINDAKLFDDSDNDKDNEIDDNDDVSKKKKKKMYLKDVTAMHLIENGPEFEEAEEDKKLSYREEQEALRKEFLDAVEKEEEDGGEFLKVKDGKEDEESEDGEYVKKLDEYFKEDEKLDENERFLKDYFRKKMWLEKDNGSGSKGLDIEDGLDVSEDEEELERQEDYEREFNFRFEENAGDRVLGHSRKVDGSVRKKENARKVQRKNKEERMAQAEAERREELKYLKNLKKKEMNEKIRKIREIAGFREDEDCALDEHDLEEEFDPEEYDKKMKKAFDDSFYEAEDVDPEFGSDEEDCELKKPNFDDEDDLLGLPKGWDEEFGTGDGFLATRERTLKNKVANGGHEEQTHDDEDVVEEEEEEEAEEEAEEEPGLQERKKRKRKTSKLEEEVIKKELEEYYKLDYEDTIGDLKTRFKYRPVNKNTYGLKPKEILVVDDKELNQLIPLKKLATYREDEYVVSRNKIKEQKLRIRSLLKGESSNGPDSGSKRSRHDSDGLDNGSKRSRHDSDGLDNGSKRSKHDDGDAETEKPKSDVQNEDSKKSRKQRRKMKLRDLVLSTSRKIAYNVLQPKPKNKKKNKA